MYVDIFVGNTFSFMTIYTYISYEDLTGIALVLELHIIGDDMHFNSKTGCNLICIHTCTYKTEYTRSLDP